jgi:4-hydroxyphenylpyruvate dioxygenase
MKAEKSQNAFLEEDKFSHSLKFEYIEFYVGNVYQAAHFYRTALGFTPVAYSGLETGAEDQSSIMIEQGDVRFLLTSAYSPQSHVNEHVRLHGDGIKDIAFSVDDVTSSFQELVRRGARVVMEPTIYSDQNGRFTKATIAAFGDTVHSLIQRNGGDSNFPPHFRKVPKSISAPAIGLCGIDHIAISAERGQLNQWVDFYNRLFGFHESHQMEVVTELSAMNSKVVQNKTGRVTFPIMEPAFGKRKSQIEEYLSFYHGAGTQHIALLSDDIITTVRMLGENGVEFLETPGSYYDYLPDRVGDIDEDLRDLKELKILADRDEQGYLLQIFTKPLQSRPTVFFEIIQRKGARGFGGGNIVALFEAVEREQRSRKTL